MPAGFFSPGEVSKKAPLSLVPKCGACGLYKTCQSPKMPLDGEGGRGILIVGEAPGRTEDARGKPFVGKTGQLLEQTLHSLKVDLREDCWITNALICRPVDNKIPDERMVDYCRPNVMKVIQEHQPHTIILLGARAVRSVIGWLWKEDPGGVNRWLGWSIPNQRLNAWICPTWHPSYLERARSDKDRRIEVMEAMWRGHLKKACSHRKRPWEQAPDYNGQVYTLSDDGEAAEAVRTYQEEGNPIAFDFETDRIKPDREDSTIICCSVSNGITSHAFPWGRKVRKAMKSLLCSPIPKYGWNVKFESRWAMKLMGVEVSNWAWDGMIATHVLDNRPEICSLKFQAFTRLGMESYDDYMKPFLKSDAPNLPNRIREAGLEKTLFYCGLDSLLEFKLAEVQRKQLGVEV